MRLVNWRVWLGRALLLGGASLLAWSGWMWYQAGVAQRRARESFERRPSVHAPAPRTYVPRHGDVLGELTIPRLRLSVMVLEGDDERILKLAAGHISGTALTPGTGNIAIAAHRDTFFRPLRYIRPDDLVTLRTRDGMARFAVRDLEIVRPSDVQVLAPAPGRDLTLVTCYPFFYLGSAPKRFIVHARQLS